MLVISIVNYNTDSGLDVVFDLFPGQEYTITLCVCVPNLGVLYTYANECSGWGYREHTYWKKI